MYGKGTARHATTKLEKREAVTADRVVGYVRVSTEQQAGEGVSLEAQRAKLRAYCAALDLELVDVIADEGASAATLKRPGLQRVLTMLETGKASTLLVVKLDRLTRSVKDLGELIEQYFANEQFFLLSVSESLDTRTAMGRFVMYILGLIAQWEREAISERTKEAMAQLRAQGYRHGRPPFGFRYSKVLDEYGRRTWEPDDSERAVLNRILALHDADRGVTEIVDELNASGVQLRRAKSWHRIRVYEILRRFGRKTHHPQGPCERPAVAEPPKFDRGAVTALRGRYVVKGSACDRLVRHLRRSISRRQAAGDGMRRPSQRCSVMSEVESPRGWAVGFGLYFIAASCRSPFSLT